MARRKLGMMAKVEVVGYIFGAMCGLWFGAMLLLALAAWLGEPKQ